MSIIRSWARRFWSRDLDIVMGAEMFRELHPDALCPWCGANVAAIAGALPTGADGVGWFCGREWLRIRPMRKPAAA